MAGLLRVAATIPTLCLTEHKPCITFVSITPTTEDKQIPMNTIALPAEYDDAKAAGWTYHRNGVAGRGFWAIVANDTLIIQPAGNDDDDICDPIHVPLNLVAPLVTAEPVADYHDTTWRKDPIRVQMVAEAGDEVTLTVFQFTDQYYDKRILAVTRPDIDDRGELECVFTLTDLLEGDASFTWRGDNLCGYMRKAKAANR